MFSSEFLFLFCVNDTATTEIYTLSLHDALPIYNENRWSVPPGGTSLCSRCACRRSYGIDRKSTRLNSCHLVISYAVICLKKTRRSCGKGSVLARRGIRFPFLRALVPC